MLLRLLAILVGVVGLGGAGYMWFAAHRPPPPAAVAQAAPAPPVMRAFVVAARYVPAGTLLRPEDLAARTAPAAEVPPSAWLDAPGARAALVGAMVQQPIAQGAALLPGLIVRPGDHGFLAAVLQPGENAATIDVDPVSGEAGLIWPGDHVDVLLVRSFADAMAAHALSSETVVRDARVVAVEQALVAGTDPGKTPASHTVTLAVTPAAALRLTLAAKLGPLTLSLLSTRPGEVADAAASAWSGDLSDGAAGAVRLYDGPTKTNDPASFRTEEFRF